MKALHVLVVLPGTLILLAMACGLYPRARRLASWISWSCFLLSVLLVAWGVLHYLVKFERSSFSDTEYWAANRIEYWMGGMIVGIFVTLLVSGELVKMGKGTTLHNLERNTIAEPEKPTDEE